MGIKLIVAIDRNGGMGKGGKLPWERIRADMKWFRSHTIRKVEDKNNSSDERMMVVMGRKTYDSLEEPWRPLPDRENVVLTRDKKLVLPKVTLAYQISTILALAENREIMGIGGAEIYAALLPHASTIYMSVIDEEFDCDTHFPEYDRTEWREAESIFVPIGDSSPYPLRLKTLNRVSCVP